MDSSVDELKVLGRDSNKSKSELESDKAAVDYAKNVNKKQVMEVKIYSPFQDYYNGIAFSLSAVNATGPFDILPEHHNFISLLSPCDLVVRTVKNGDRKVQISGGIIHVKSDKVIVFLDV